MHFIDLIKRRKNVVHQESEGVNLAIYFINNFIQRTFSLHGINNNYSRINGQQLLTLLQSEIDSNMLFYRYLTRVKTYRDRKGVPQLHIKLIGRASMMNRYNPMDVEMNITTEN